MASVRFTQLKDPKHELALRNFISFAQPYVEVNGRRTLITDAAEMKRLFRSLAFKYHPDKTSEEQKRKGSNNTFDAIATGMQVLKDYTVGDKIEWPIETPPQTTPSPTVQPASAASGAAAQAEAEAEAEERRQAGGQRMDRLPPRLDRIARKAVEGTDRSPMDLLLGAAVVHLVLQDEKDDTISVLLGLYVRGMLVPNRSVVVRKSDMTPAAFSEKVSFHRKSILSGVALDLVTVKWHEMPFFMLAVKGDNVEIKREMWASDLRNIIYASSEEQQRPEPIVRGEVPPDIYAILAELLTNPRLFGARQAGVLIFEAPASGVDSQWTQRVLVASARARADRKMSGAEITRAVKSEVDSFLSDPMIFIDIGAAVSNVLALLSAQGKSLDDVSVVVYRAGKTHLLSM